MILRILAALCVFVYGVFILSGIMLKIMPDLRHTWFNTLWYWTKYPAAVAMPGVGVIIVLRGDELGPVENIQMVINLVVWWLYRNSGDDDFTKKLKKKLTETVQEIEGRLVVTPLGAQ